jgi:hypothetical protein
MKRPILWACATLSLAAHAVLIQAWHEAATRPGPPAASRSMRVSWRAQSSAPQATQAALDAEAAPQLSWSLSLADPPPDAAPPPEQPAVPTAPPLAPDAAPVVVNLPIEGNRPAQREEDSYLARPFLSVPPVAQGVVVLTAPPDAQEVARHVGVLSLFIDETGRVNHILPSEPRLPPAFEKVAIEAFMGLRYSPGQLEGQTVKSRIRVEVVFDNTPLDKP